jgi:hypothetical protein
MIGAFILNCLFIGVQFWYCNVLNLGIVNLSFLSYIFFNFLVLY